MKQYILISLVFISVCSCEVVLDVDIPKKDPVIVVNSYLNPDSTISIDLSEDAFILTDKSFTPITSASITLRENNALVGSFVESRDGYYQSGVIPQPGRKYDLVVSKAGYAEVTSSTDIPTNIQATYLGYSYLVNEHLLEIEIEIDDPQEENYYEFLIFRETLNLDFENGTFKRDTLMNYGYIIVKDSEVDEPTAGRTSVLIDDKIFNGKKRKFKLSFRYWYEYKNPEMIIEIRSCNKDYFNYKKSMAIQAENLNDEDPFAEPVFVTNNITNGYGIFAGYASQKFTDIIEAED